MLVCGPPEIMYGLPMADMLLDRPMDIDETGIKLPVRFPTPGKAPNADIPADCLVSSLPADGKPVKFPLNFNQAHHKNFT